MAKTNRTEEKFSVNEEVAEKVYLRLCELLISPSRHYKRTDKYLRALEKNINVVTTITENGERVTGIEPFPGELDISPTLRIEEPFFVQVYSVKVCFHLFMQNLH